MQKEARIKALRSVPLLAGLSRRDLDLVDELGRDNWFRAGYVIVKAGNQARDFYLILQGQARLSVPGKRPRILGPGDYFGEMSVLDGGPRSATIAAQTKVLALRIDRRDFLALLDAYGSIGRKILVEMTKRVRAAEGASGRH